MLLNPADSRAALVPLCLTAVLHFVQCWCGINVIVFNTVSVFSSLGSTAVSGYTATAVVM